ncbi:MAG TPA: GerAB/ArcD/ProY family transporter [Symbiobacteriaceae bacterium]|nr:GerAB/ArcD/ProY family transporter [Symbiobacteriaceae bacterium]
MVLRAQAHLVSILFLPAIPELIVAAAIAGVAALAARSGLEVLGRTAEVLVLAAPRLDPRSLKPVLEQGWGRPLAGTPLALGYLGICMVMGMFQAYQNHPAKAVHAKLFAAVLGSVLLTGSTLGVIALLGPDVAGATLFPELSMSREISIADFLERLDSVWMMIHVGAGFLTVGVLLWAAALGTAQTFGLPQYRQLVVPLALLAVPLSMWLFRNSAALITFARGPYPWITIGVLLDLQLAVALVTLLRGAVKAQPPR